MGTIEKMLCEIKELTGLSLVTCDYFTGLKNHNGKQYFNIMIDSPVYISKEYDALSSISRKYKKFSVEPCGHKRLSIIF